MNLGKLWLRLMGIGEEADLSRRGFLRMLGGVAAVSTVAPTYVFAPEGGWKSGLSVFAGGLTMRDPLQYVVPSLVDNYFKPSPVFTRLLKYGALPTGTEKIHNEILFNVMGKRGMQYCGIRDC